jgi:hypothetical protein
MDAVPIIVALGLAACGQGSAAVGSSSDSEPARVEHIEGTELSLVILSSRAAERLGILTVAVRDEQVDGMPRKIIPYAAVLYDAHGDAWTYTSPEPLRFVRYPISIDYIEGDMAVLTDGPPAGTAVVSVGAAELYGTEYGVGH